MYRNLLILLIFYHLTISTRHVCSHNSQQVVHYNTHSLLSFMTCHSSHKTFKLTFNHSYQLTFLKFLNFFRNNDNIIFL